MQDKNNDSAIIAIVEDNPDNMLLLRVLLQERFQLIEYFDGETAVSGILAVKPDLVLMDISLPGISGVETLHKIRQAGLADVPIVALTAHAMVGDREKFLAEGFDYYVSKPILGLKQLLEPIEVLLAQMPAT